MAHKIEKFWDWDIKLVSTRWDTILLKFLYRNKISEEPIDLTGYIFTMTFKQSRWKDQTTTW